MDTNEKASKARTTRKNSTPALAPAESGTASVEAATFTVKPSRVTSIVCGNDTIFLGKGVKRITVETVDAR